ILWTSGIRPKVLSKRSPRSVGQEQHESCKPGGQGAKDEKERKESNADRTLCCRLICRGIHPRALQLAPRFRNAQPSRDCLKDAVLHSLRNPSRRPADWRAIS